MTNNEINIKQVRAELVEYNEGQIKGVPENYMIRTEQEESELRESISELPEMAVARAAIVYPLNGKYVVIGGNGRVKAQKQLGKKEIPVITLPVDTPVEKIRRIAMLDNDIKGTIDWVKVAHQWDKAELKQWNIATPKEWGTQGDEYEKTMQELRAKLDAGEISEDDEEYQAFVSKFEVKKTTDDCYTPTNVYEAVVEWCEKEYGINRNKIVRPFYPNGDYTKYPYEKDSIVLDNPPFSILAEITRYYTERGVKFFLFAPSLTLFNAGKTCTAICIGINVLYENKARVCTSFLTNLNGNVRFRSCPELYEALNKANEENNGKELVTLAKYEYPAHVATSSNIALMSKYGVEFSATVEETLKVSALDSQKEYKKSIFGDGYLLSEEMAKDKARAQEQVRERQQPQIWKLSKREEKIIKQLGNDKK